MYLFGLINAAKYYIRTDCKSLYFIALAIAVFT